MRKGFQRQPEAFPIKLKFLFINFNLLVILFYKKFILINFYQKEANNYRPNRKLSATFKVNYF